MTAGGEVTEILEGAGSFEGLPDEEPFPGVRRRTFSSRGATVSRYLFEPGASFPLHSHPQEQITLIEEGSIEITVAGESTPLEGGSWSVVSPDVEHGITAGPDGARIVALVVPRRERPDEYSLSKEAP